MNLQENAKPPTVAAVQNQRQRFVSRNRQKHQNMAVVPAIKGSSMVARAPWAMRLGLEREEPGRERHRAGTVTVPAPGRRQAEGDEPDPC